MAPGWPQMNRQRNNHNWDYWGSHNEQEDSALSSPDWSPGHHQQRWWSLDELANENEQQQARMMPNDSPTLPWENNFSSCYLRNCREKSSSYSHHRGSDSQSSTNSDRSSPFFPRDPHTPPPQRSQQVSVLDDADMLDRYSFLWNSLPNDPRNESKPPVHAALCCKAPTPPQIQVSALAKPQKAELLSTTSPMSTPRFVQTDMSEQDREVKVVSFTPPPPPVPPKSPRPKSPSALMKPLSSWMHTPLQQNMNSRGMSTPRPGMQSRRARPPDISLAPKPTFLEQSIQPQLSAKSLPITASSPTLSLGQSNLPTSDYLAMSRAPAGSPSFMTCGSSVVSSVPRSTVSRAPARQAGQHPGRSGSEGSSKYDNGYPSNTNVENGGRSPLSSGSRSPFPNWARSPLPNQDNLLSPQTAEQKRPTSEELLTHFPEKLSPYVAQQTFPKNEFQMLQNEAMGRAQMFKILKHEDVKSLAEELVSLDKRRDFLGEIQSTLRRQRQTVRNQMVRNFQSCRDKTISKKEVIRQEEYLINLDNSFENSVTNLQEAETKQTRVQQHLLEHTAAVLMLQFLQLATKVPDQRPESIKPPSTFQPMTDSPIEPTEIQKPQMSLEEWIANYIKPEREAVLVKNGGGARGLQGLFSHLETELETTLGDDESCYSDYGEASIPFITKDRITGETFI